MDSSGRVEDLCIDSLRQVRDTAPASASRHWTFGSSHLGTAPVEPDRSAGCGAAKLSDRAPAWDAEGREAVFSHYLLSDVFLCSQTVASYLEGLARELNAAIEVHDHFIVLRGRDHEGPGLLPSWLGGERGPGR